MMKSRTEGNAFASCTQNAANSALPFGVEVTPSGRNGETMKMIWIPCAFAAVIARWSAACSVIVAGRESSHQTLSRTTVIPTPVSCE